MTEPALPRTRAIYASVRRQAYRNWSLLLLSCGAALVVVLAIFLLGKLTNIPLENLTRDPAAISRTNAFFGLLTFMGLILWSAAVVACLLGYLLLGDHAAYQQERHFLLFGALLTAILLTDDALMLHEYVIPRLLHISEYAVYAAYAAFAALYFSYYYRSVIRSDYLVLLAAGGGFTLSILIDKFIPANTQVTFIEDSIKFVGIALWAVYYLRYAVEIVRERFLAHERNSAQ